MQGLVSGGKIQLLIHLRGKHFSHIFIQRHKLDYFSMLVCKDECT